MFNGISTFAGYLMPKLSLIKKSGGTFKLIHVEWGNGINKIFKGYCTKIDIIA